MKSFVPCKWFAVLLPALFCILSAKTFAQCSVQAYITNGPSALLCSGSPLELQAQSNTGYTNYQWQKQTENGAGFTNIEGATSSTLSATSLGSYRVIVGNDACKDTSSITNIIKLSLNGGTISGGPSSKICADSYVGSLSGPTVAGDELGLVSYQWQLKEGNGAYRDIPLAKGHEFNAGYVKVITTFRRAAIDRCGNVAYSNELKIDLFDFPTAGILSPIEQTVVAGANPVAIGFTTMATGNGNLAYKWQSSLSINGPWSNIENATGATYQPGAVDANTYFRRIVSTDVCSYTATSEAVVVKVLSPQILNAGVLYSNNSCLFPGNIPYPVATKIEPVGGVPPYLVEWEFKTTTGNWTLISGQHSSKIFPGPITETTIYRKKVTDAAGTVAYSDVATLNVISGPLVAGKIFATTSVACLGNSPGQIISTESGANFGERGSYQWQIKIGAGNWTDIYGATRGYFQPQPLTESSSFRRVFYDSCGPFGRIAFSNEVTIEAKPALLAGDIGPSTQLVLPGRIPSLLKSLQAPGGGTNSYTIRWEKADFATGPWTKIANASGAQYQPPVADKTSYYRRVVSDNNCHAEKITFVIEVQVPDYPAMVGGTLSGSGCAFAGLKPAKLTSGSVAASGGIAPYTYQWEKRTGANTFLTIDAATGEDYQPDILTATTQYRRKVTDSYGTSAYSEVFTVQLITTALIPGKIEVSNTEICAGSTVGTIKSIADGSGLGGNAIYQWQQRVGSAAFSNIAGATQKDYTPNSLMQTTYFRRVFSDECSGVVRTGYSNEVMIKATPSATLLAGLIDGSFITCSGTTPGIIRNVLSACGSCNLKYEWEVKNGGEWTLIAGANGASYTPAIINASTQYRRKVVDGLGRTAYSNTVEILVYPGIEAGTIGAEKQVLCVNAMPNPIALLTDCHYTDGTVTYQWQKAANAAGPWTNITDANQPAYQPGLVTATEYYRLKVTSTTCGAVAFTNTAVVETKTVCAFKIATGSDQFNTCGAGEAGKVFIENLQACASEISIEWQYKALPGSSWVSTGISTASLTINDYYKPEETLLEWRLKIVAKDCNTTTYSNTIKIARVTCKKILPIVYPNPVVTGQMVTIETTNIPHKLVLRTIDGKKLDFTVISSSNGLFKIMLPTLASGTYVLTITSTAGQWTKKLIVKR